MLETEGVCREPGKCSSLLQVDDRTRQQLRELSEDAGDAEEEEDEVEVQSEEEEAEAEAAWARVQAETDAEIAAQTAELALVSEQELNVSELELDDDSDFDAESQTECKPPVANRRDGGYDDSFRGWYDVQGCGRCNDYCRWVGSFGSGGDPATRLVKTNKNGKKESWWSCRLAAKNVVYTGKTYFKSWGFQRCTAEGAETPPSPTPYVQGEAGKPWTADEMLIVRAKLLRVFTQGTEVYAELGLTQPAEWWTSKPNAAKALRLGFHDCLKYKDGTGGCDGCLEWHGVGVRHPWDTLGKGMFPANAADDGHNNGLGPIAEVLEAVYTDAGFPKRTPRLPVSLQQMGKSRADLWAFAAIVAVEHSIELNNAVCKNPASFKGGARQQCHPREGLSDCQVEPPRALTFKTGRSDCRSEGQWAGDDTHSFKTSKAELHPDPNTNGHGTIRFFKDNFKFTGRETVAIMGAHTIGRVHVIQSLFRYTWKTTSGLLFNNGYHRNLAKKEDWYFPSGGWASKCEKVGNSTGGWPASRWVAHVRGDTTAGGPVQFINEKLVCKSWVKGSETPPTCKDQDLQWKFVSGIDETMLPCEMGLYKDFQVDQNGIPSGCPGFKDFNLQKWGRNSDGGLRNYDFTWSRINNKKDEAQCPPTMIREPSDAEPTSAIIEEFASDGNAFVRDFFPALEKMLANGYEGSELQDAPVAGMSGFSCPIRDPWDHTNEYKCTPTS